MDDDDTNLVARVRRRHKVAFLCHDAAEYASRTFWTLQSLAFGLKIVRIMQLWYPIYKVVLANRIISPCFLAALEFPP